MIPTIIVVLLTAVTSFAQGYQAEKVRSRGTTHVTWSPLVESSSVDTDQIFPAEILALATRHVQKLSPRYLGDPNGVLGVSIASSTPDTHVRVSIKVDRLAEETGFETTMADADQQYEIWPTLRFDTRALARIRESFPTTAVFSVSANGGPPSEQTRTIRVRSVNDVPLAYRTKEGRVRDVSWPFAAFVDENHPGIDSLLSQALKDGAVREFVGYHGSPEEVIRQVFAIWNVLERQGVKYSNITQPSSQSESVFSQHVRFLDEVRTNSEANCVDGTVLFASVIYKLGMCPVLVLKPSHMFLGFYLDHASCERKRNLMFLETTRIGSQGLNQFQRGWTFKTADGYKNSASYQHFRQALDVGNKEFQSIANSLNARDPRYHVIEVTAARRAGISPIPRF